MIRTLTAAALVLLSFSAVHAADDATATSTPAVSTSGASSPAPAAVPAPAVPAKPFAYTPKDTDVVTGKSDAPVTIVEYASLSCPHCSHFYVHELPELTTKYIDTGKARLVYRDYPLNDPALKAAELVQCADPESRHAFIKVLFSNQSKWAYDTNFRNGLSNIAGMGGVDRLKFESCMNDKTLEKAVLGVAKEASDDYKVNSTPTFFINGVEFKGDRDAASMGKAIEAATQKPKQ